MARKESVEEKIAVNLGKMINNLEIDLEQLGKFIGRQNQITYRRFQLIAESAKYEKEEKDNDTNYLF